LCVNYGLRQIRKIDPRTQYAPPLRTRKRRKLQREQEARDAADLFIDDLSEESQLI
jgi:hypothetical protein